MEPSTGSPDAVAGMTRRARNAARAPRGDRWRRWRIAGLATVTAAATGTAGWSVAKMRGSLPQLDGVRRLGGLVAEVRVERDGVGVPSVHATCRADAARVLGFLHAQDRFFQMDVLRRRAAGELAELVGPMALPVDRQARLHRLRAVAHSAFAAAPPRDRDLLEAYGAGVNDGLAALAAAPPEYLALSCPPRPWLPEDSLLCVLAMFLDLHDDAAALESLRGAIHEILAPDVAAFLLPAGSPWDAPVAGGALPLAPLPDSAVVDLRRAPPPPLAVRHDADAADEPWAPTGGRRGEVVIGSNNWAVAGTHTANGGALLAGDMHLRLGVPGIWYRAALHWRDGDEPGEGVARSVVGVTLPGTPAVVAGSNGRVAWAFTNTEGDWADLVVVEADPEDPGRYRTPDGPRPFGRETETIVVRGAADDVLEIETTVWGPVLDRDHRGRKRVLRWTAHDPTAVNLRLLDFETVADVDDAVRLAPHVGVPAQNLVCADAAGRIAWTIIGRIPKRRGWDGSLPVSWADGTCGWDGWLAADDYPRLVDPPSGRLWSANARVADADGARLVGDEGQDLGARQGQIRDRLLGLDGATAADMLALQLDDRALFLGRWQALLLDLLTPDRIATMRQRAEARTLVGAWGGRATVDSVGYRIVRAFRSTVARRALGAITAPVEAADARGDYLAIFRRWEAPLWQLVSARPPHLLDPRYRTWDDLLLAALDETLDALGESGPLEARTWGEWNTSRIRHPLSAAVPALADWLDMPAEPLPGDAHMPRVQAPQAGASQRMVVSPGREAEGFFHMPAGQSGHPLSPHYGDGHEAWVRGEPTPFLPGPTRSTLVLRP